MKDLLHNLVEHWLPYLMMGVLFGSWAVALVYLWFGPEDDDDGY